MRNACLAFMVIGGDGLYHRKSFPETSNPETEREREICIDSSSPSFQYAAESHSPSLVLLVYSIHYLATYL